MHAKPIVLARYQDFGSVTRCLHGCVHVQVGHTVMVLTSDQYQDLVAMINESAANHELFLNVASLDSDPDRSFPGQRDGLEN